MARRIAIVQGHPDPSTHHLDRLLADAYASGATAAGHDVRAIDLATLDFPLLRSADDFERGDPTPAIRACQESLAWADHLVIVYPLWLGDMPALLKAFLEQVFRPTFTRKASFFGRGVLTGKSARIIVTMGMPAFIYRWYFHAHSLRSLEQNILGFAGARPVHDTIIGGAGNLSEGALRRWNRTLARLGRDGA
jgi:putative NADPH-quinone reductase